MRRSVGEFHRSPAALVALLEVAELHGLSRAACLAGSEVDLADLDIPGPGVLGAQELAVIRNLVSVTADAPGLGAESGTRFQLATLGVFGLAMMSSGTLRELIAVGVRQGWGKFSWGLLPPRVEENRSGWRIVYDEANVPADVRNFVIERDLAFCASVLVILTGARANLIAETTLTADRVAGLRGVLGSRLTVVGGSANVIQFSWATLDAALPTSDTYAAAACELQCEQVLAGQQVSVTGGSARAKVEATLMSLPAQLWTLDQVADARRVHPRTLNRMLAAEDTSFREIVESRRVAVATGLLTETDLSVSQIADLVGYTEPSSLVRAYRRRTGRTPGAVKRSSRPHPGLRGER